jgi:undecaprenyl-diphosphatase
MMNFELAAIKCGGEYGFVSSHASTVWAIFGIINFSRPTKGLTIFFLIWAITVSYSRVYLGVHYPGDVICGAMLGLFISYFLNRWRTIPRFK